MLSASVIPLSLLLTCSFQFPVKAFVYTSFQPQLIRCKSTKEITYPSNLQSLQGIVKQALYSNDTVKPIGALHSGTDIICTSGTPVGMTKITHFTYDFQRHVVTVGAGIRLLELLERLHNIGRTLEAIPTYGDITIGGALGTGSHGTGLDHPVAISDLVIALAFVDGLGNVRNVTDPRTLRAFRTNLGLLGIVYEVTLRTVSQFKLKIEHRLVDDVALDGHHEIVEMAKSNYRFQLWWFPTARSVVLSAGMKVDMKSNAGDCRTHFITDASREMSQGGAILAERIQWGRNRFKMFLLQKLTMLSLVAKIPGRSPIFEDNQSVGGCIPVATGLSHRMQTNSCKICSWDHGNDSLSTQEFAVAMPLEEFTGAVKTIRSIIAEYPIDFPLNGIFIRFLSTSDGLLSISGGRDASVVFEWAVIPRQNRFEKAYLGMPASQAMMQALIFKHNGRPHWSKNGLYYFNPKLISRRYPYFDTFVNYMRTFDPYGIFRNDFGLRLLGFSSQTPFDSEAKHCGLVDNCICSKDDDCSSSTRGRIWGNGRPYVCGELQGYKVCRDNDVDKVRESFQGLKNSLRSFSARNNY